MRVAVLAGIRGGAGTTSVVAMLGEALHALGQRVLMADLGPSDLLRLHFNVPYADRHGWTAAGAPRDWRRQTFEAAPGLCLTPFGPGAGDVWGVDHGARAEAFWLDVLADSSLDADWVIFDCAPEAWMPVPALRARSSLDVLVAPPDAAAHVLLARHGLAGGRWLLVNGLDPSGTLAGDIVVDWRRRHGERVVPVVIPRDESVHEALALKTTVARRMPDAAASDAARSLALWCLAARPGGA